MRAICFSLVLLSLATTKLTYADASNDAKRDKAKREIEACLRRNEVSSRQCKSLNRNIATLIDIYQQGDKTVLQTLLRFTYLTDFYADALASDPDSFLTAVSQLSERERQDVASGIAGAVYGLSKQRFEAVRTTLMKVPDSSANYQLAQSCLQKLDTENAFFLTRYFPPEESGGPTANFVRWFSRDLYALEEKPLWPPSSSGSERMYRVTAFPAFTFPRSVTLTVLPDETGEVRLRATDVHTNSMHTISSQQVADFTQTLDRIQFWQLPTNSQQLGTNGAYILDGAYFILEGVQDGRYHIVVRLCPGNTPFGETVRNLFHLADAKFSGC